MIQLNGIFPPLPTSFDKDENLAMDMMIANIEKLSAYDLRGFLVLGSNGELVHLSDAEKAQVYEKAREVITPDKLMIAGTGGQSTRETVMLTRAAAKAGADAVLVLNPFYFKGLMNPEALKNHYFAVADASTIPVIIYNMPANSGMDMDADTLLILSEHPNIIGLKDSGGNVAKMGAIRKRAKPDFQILAGSAGFLVPAMSVGACGGILASANIAPAQCIAMHKAFNSGDINAASRLQLDIIPVNNAVTKKWGVPALKTAMDYIGLYGGPARKPILPLNAGAKAELLKILDDYNIKA
ncbi:MAG: dihydrodipicolinate synthase family protein [Bacteroidales bacterium]|nr:dihydrodipicolinate synthase family protein [Bacteroidales bacterium]